VPGIARGEHPAIAIRERHFEVAAEAQHHGAARLRPSLLQESDVAGRDVSGQAQVHLTHAATLAPGFQDASECRVHGTIITNVATASLT
jgi:hypothetical protein